MDRNNFGYEDTSVYSNGDGTHASFDGSDYADEDLGEGSRPFQSYQPDYLAFLETSLGRGSPVDGSGENTIFRSPYNEDLEEDYGEALDDEEFFFGDPHLLEDASE